MMTDLVKLYGPKTFLGIGADSASIEDAIRYKSINRIMLCSNDPEDQPFVDRVLLQQQFLGEVEWVLGSPKDTLSKISYKYDFVHIKDEYGYQELLDAWKLCKILIIIHDVNAPVIKKFMDEGLKDGQTVRVTRYGKAIVIAK